MAIESIPRPARRFFVAGTDTGVGKTTVAAALLIAARRRGLATVALKPIATGAECLDGEWRNADALALQAAQGGTLAYARINPLLFAPAIAPHLALADAGCDVSAAGLRALCRDAESQAHDFAVIEGAGGWCVPLNATETLADLAREFGYPVILVVGLRLGCINHALLSAEAIRRDGLELAGWVGCQIDAGMARVEDNVATLRARLAAPCLGIVPWQPGVDSERVAGLLAIDRLIGDAAQGGKGA